MLGVVLACGSTGPGPGAASGASSSSESASHGSSESATPELQVPAPRLAGAKERKSAGPTRLRGGRDRLPLSVATVPVSVSLRAIADRLDRLLPGGLRKHWHRVEDGKGRKVDLTYRVTRGKPDLSWSDGVLVTHLPVSYHARFKAEVKNPIPLGPRWIRLTEGTDWGTAAEPQRVVLEVRTHLEISPDWRLSSRTTMSEVAFPPPPPGDICIKKGIRICVSKSTVAPSINRQIEKELAPHLRGIFGEIDQRLKSEVRLRQRMEKLWSTLQCPLRLSKAAPEPVCDCRNQSGPSRYLQLAPEGLFLSELSGDGRQVRATVGMSGRPTVIDGLCPSSGRRPLPEARPAPGRAGFELVVETEIPFTDLSRILDKNLKGKRFPPKGEQQVVVEKAEVAGGQIDNARQLIVIRLLLGGVTRSVIYLRGYLQYRPEKKEIRLADPDYTVETEDLFVVALDSLNHEGFRKRLARFARWDLGPELEKAKQLVEKTLGGRKKGGLHLKGRIDSLQPADYAVTDTGVIVRLAARGQLQVQFHR